MIKLVIFDLWRTLIPATIDFVHLQALLKKNNLSRNEFITRYEKTTQLKEYKNFEELRNDFFNEFKEQDNLTLEQELYEIYINRFDKIYFFDDVVSNLKKLKNQGYKIALLSNTESFIKKSFEEKLGAKELIDFFGYSYVLGELKPSKNAFLKVLKEFNVLPKEAIMVGDSLRSDILGSKNVGINNCWINRDDFIIEKSEVKPDFTIKSLNEIFSVLGELNAKI